MPIRTARALGSSLIAGTVVGFARWLAASLVIGAGVAAVAFVATRQFWPGAAFPAALLTFCACPVVMLPVIWANAVRSGVTAAVRDSGLSRTLADVVVTSFAGTDSSRGPIDGASLEHRVREAARNAVPVGPGWFKNMLSSAIARRVVRAMTGGLGGDLPQPLGVEPEVLRDRIAARIEAVAGDWSAARRAA